MPNLHRRVRDEDHQISKYQLKFKVKSTGQKIQVSVYGRNQHAALSDAFEQLHAEGHMAQDLEFFSFC